MNMKRKAQILAIAILILLTAAFSFTPNTVTANDLTNTLRGEEPLTGFTFMLTLDNGFEGYFTEISDIGTTNDLIERRIVDSSGKEVTLLAPGKLKVNPITIKRGLTADIKLWDWRQQVVNGLVSEARTNGEITIFDRNYTPIAIWSFSNGWLSGYKTSDENGMPVEVGTLVCDNIIRKK